MALSASLSLRAAARLARHRSTEQTQPLASRFDEIWATGEAGLSGTVLGL
jgi:hypothetical protein